MHFLIQLKGLTDDLIILKLYGASDLINADSKCFKETQ